MVFRNRKDRFGGRGARRCGIRSGLPISAGPGTVRASLPTPPPLLVTFDRFFWFCDPFRLQLRVYFVNDLKVQAIAWISTNRIQDALHFLPRQIQLHAAFLYFRRMIRNWRATRETAAATRVVFIATI
jgi:hypothetical protein